MKKIQKNGNKRNVTQSKKNVLSGIKQKPTRRRKRNVLKGRKRKGQMKILVNDRSLVGAAEIYGRSHHKGNKIPGHKVLVVEDLMKAYRKIGARRAIIYSIAA